MIKKSLYLLIMVILLASSVSASREINCGLDNCTDLVALWHLDETSANNAPGGSDVEDVSGSGFHGNETGGITFGATGRIGTALSYDGSDDLINLGVNLFNGQTVGTWMAWIKQDDDSGNPIFTLSEQTDASNSIQLLGTGGGIRLQFFTSANNNNIKTSDIFNDSAFHHIVGQTDGSDYSIYVDGVFVAQEVAFGADNGIWVNSMEAGTITYDIGHFKRSTSEFFFNGTIDEVVIFSRTLSASEILGFYNIGASPLSITTSFTEAGGSTNFSSVSNMSSVPNMKLATSNANIVWNNAVDAKNDDYDTHVSMGSGFVSINTSSLDSSINASANVTLVSIECSLCNGNGIVYSVGSFGTLSSLQVGATSCGLAGTCSDFSSCVGEGDIGDCTFTVTGFTGFGAGGNANLTINDSAEGSNVEVNTAIDFFGFYVNATDGTPVTPALGGNCNVTFDDAGTVFEMTFNGTGNDAYNFTKTAGFSSVGTHLWNVTCAGTLFSHLVVNDTVDVTAASNIPEFSDYALILALVITLCGFFFIRKRE